MGIDMNVYKDGKVVMNLSEYSITNITFLYDMNEAVNSGLHDITRDVLLEGVVNADSIDIPPTVRKDKNGEKKEELREIDSVRKLVNWAMLPENSECYRDVEIKMSNAMGILVKEEQFTDLYVIEYRERFDDEMGCGKFNIHLREKK